MQIEQAAELAAFVCGTMSGSQAVVAVQKRQSANIGLQSSDGERPFWERRPAYTATRQAAPGGSERAMGPAKRAPQVNIEPKGSVNEIGDRTGRRESDPRTSGQRIHNSTHARIGVEALRDATVHDASVSNILGFRVEASNDIPDLLVQDQEIVVEKDGERDVTEGTMRSWRWIWSASIERCRIGTDGRNRHGTGKENREGAAALSELERDTKMTDLLLPDSKQKICRVHQAYMARLSLDLLCLDQAQKRVSAGYDAEKALIVIAVRKHSTSGKWLVPCLAWVSTPKIPFFKFGWSAPGQRARYSLVLTLYWNPDFSAVLEHSKSNPLAPHTTDKLTDGPSKESAAMQSKQKLYIPSCGRVPQRGMRRHRER
ncbi:hypothetical protein DFH06DRAFT_1306879 [Mycena polygramma]|nr:hypothetical protein DFH06DRAFT_1306879 [Mycena polygramma]